VDGHRDAAPVAVSARLDGRLADRAAKIRHRILSISKLGRWHVREAAEIGEVVERALAGRLGMVAPEGDSEGVSGRRRERQRIHEMSADPTATLLTVERTLAFAPELQTSEPCAWPAWATEVRIWFEVEPESRRGFAGNAGLGRPCQRRD
jgi:hypothetical protein